MVRKVKVYSPDSFKHLITSIVEDYGDEIVDEGEDFGISFQHGDIFTTGELLKPILNIHFSDTEMVRGCNLISYVINHGWNQTAITYHWIDEGIDTGPIFAKVKLSILPTDTAKTLYDRCVEKAVDYFCIVYPSIRNSDIGRPNTSKSPYVARDSFTRELLLTESQQRFIRSRMFPGKPKPYITINGEELEIG